MTTQFYLDEDHYLTVGWATCDRCSGTGEVLEIHPCYVCGGTGLGPRGGKGGCTGCSGYREQWGPDMTTCPVCHGQDSMSFSPGKITDTLPIKMVLKIPIEFWRANPAPGGKLIEVRDAGATLGYDEKKMTGVALLQLVKNPVPAIKMVHEDTRGWRFADRLVIYHDIYGYVIKPVWD